MPTEDSANNSPLNIGEIQEVPLSTVNFITENYTTQYVTGKDGSQTTIMPLRSETGANLTLFDKDAAEMPALMARDQKELAYFIDAAIKKIPAHYLRKAAREIVNALYLVLVINAGLAKGQLDPSQEKEKPLANTLHGDWLPPVTPDVISHLEQQEWEHPQDWQQSLF